MPLGMCEAARIAGDGSGVNDGHVSMGVHRGRRFAGFQIAGRPAEAEHDAHATGRTGSIRSTLPPPIQFRRASLARAVSVVSGLAMFHCRRAPRIDPSFDIGRLFFIDLCQYYGNFALQWRLCRKCSTLLAETCACRRGIVGTTAASRCGLVVWCTQPIGSDCADITAGGRRQNGVSTMIRVMGIRCVSPRSSAG